MDASAARTAHDCPAHRVGAVVIGRNEGARLVRCLDALARARVPVAYVDSGSSDGSAALARSRGCSVRELDPARPFSAARARNEGLHVLLQQHPEIEYVQFVDGDCELVEGWLGAGTRELEAAAAVAVVCGRLRERSPTASPYNRLCDIEWDRAPGEVDACGGVFLARAAAVTGVGGFDPKVVAGEEPELCLRLRRQGWRIRRIAAEMALHDAALLRFGQWWRRTMRAGHAYAQGAALHGAGRERFCVRENLSIVFWALAWPMAAAGFLRWAPLASVSMLAAYPLLAARIARAERRSGRALGDSWLHACFCVLGKWPQHLGQWRYLLAHWRGRRPQIIEHKLGGPGH